MPVKFWEYAVPPLMAMTSGIMSADGGWGWLAILLGALSFLVQLFILDGRDPNGEETMRAMRAEADLRDNMLVMKQLRDFLAGALCAECGEGLGHDEEIISDDKDRTIHKRCDQSE